MSVKSILICGGTGWLGSQVCESVILSKKFNVRVLIRSDTLEKKKTQIESYKANGAEIFVGDITSVEDLTNAAKGCDTILSLVGGETLAHQANLIPAAKAAGVKRIIPSQFGIDVTELPQGTALQAKNDFLNEIKAEGFDWTAIMTGMFYDLWFTANTGFDHQNGNITIVDNGQAKISATLIADIAKFVPEILASPHSRNAVVRICGDTLTSAEAIKIFEEASGKKMQVKNRTLDDCKEELKRGFNFFTLLHILVITVQNAVNFEGRNDNSKFPAIKPTSVREYAKSLYKK